MITVSLTMRTAMNQETTEEVVAVLLRLTHPDIVGTARLSSDPTQRLSTDPLRYGTISGGFQYLFCPMKIVLPDDAEDRPPIAKLEVENINRDLIELVRSVTTPGKCDIDLILAGTPNVVEINYPELDIMGYSVSAATLSLEFGIDSLEDEPFPANVFGPSGFPGLFG